MAADKPRPLLQNSLDSPLLLTKILYLNDMNMNCLSESHLALLMDIVHIFFFW